MKTMLGSRFAGAVLIVALLLIWQGVTVFGLVRSPSLPPVSEIFTTWWHLIVTGEIAKQLLPSLVRIGAGYGAAVVAGVLFGIFMGYYRTAYNLFEPLTELLRPIPSPAYIPLAILFLGLGDEMKIFVIFFACVFRSCSTRKAAFVRSIRCRSIPAGPSDSRACRSCERSSFLQRCHRSLPGCA